MKKIIIASQGTFAEGLLSAAEMIMGKTENISAYGLSNYESPYEISSLIEKQIHEKKDDDWIILCDISGGSIHNQLVKLCCNEHVYVIGGCTLSMVLELALSAEEDNLPEMIRHTLQGAKESISYLDHSTALELIKERETEDDNLW